MSDVETRVRVAAVAEVPSGEGRTVEARGRPIAVFNVDGRFYAIDHTCSHRGGPLGERDLAGAVASGPWIAGRSDVTTAANVNNPVVKVACFPVVVEDGHVFVELP